MSDFKFDCPKCGQNIVCDTSNAGMQIPCPECQTMMTVPQPPPAFVPSVPAGPAKLSINKTAHHAPPPPASAVKGPAQPASWGQKATAPAARKRSGTPKWAMAIIYVVLALAAAGGGWYGWSKYSEKIAREKAAQDAADEQKRIAQEQQAKEEAAKARAARANWRLDVAGAEFPDRPASGKIHGVDFTVETAFIQNGVMTLRQESGSSRQFLIYLPVKPGDPIAEKTFSAVATDTTKQPQVVMNWKDEPPKLPGAQSFTKGYGMKIEFGTAVDGKIPAKIYLSVPDTEQSYVAGHFEIAPKKVAGQPVIAQPPTGEPRGRKPRQT